MLSSPPFILPWGFSDLIFPLSPPCTFVIQAASGKYVKDVDAIDFSAYKNKLKFTGAAVDDLEKIYKNMDIPQYTASLPAFEATKRASMLEVVKSTVNAAKADLELLHADIAKFEDGRITSQTSIAELEQRFPALAKEIESEIKGHEWSK